MDAVVALRSPQSSVTVDFCIVPCCRNDSGKDRRNGVLNRKYYRFPVNKKRLVLWLKIAQDQGWPSRRYRHARVCSDHFTGGENSEDPNDAAYVPTIFPSTDAATSPKYMYAKRRCERIVKQYRAKRVTVKVPARPKTDTPVSLNRSSRLRKKNHVEESQRKETEMEVATPEYVHDTNSDVATPEYVHDMKSDVATPEYVHDMKSDVATPEYVHDMKSDVATPEYVHDMKSDVATPEYVHDMKSDVATPEYVNDTKSDVATPEYVHDTKSDVTSQIKLEPKDAEDSHKRETEMEVATAESFHDRKSDAASQIKLESVTVKTEERFSPTGLPEPSFSPVQEKVYTHDHHGSEMMRKLTQLWCQEELCDAIISNGVDTLKAHKVVLIASCPVLMSLDKKIWSKTALMVNLPSSIRRDTINAFLIYVYKGTLRITVETFFEMKRLAMIMKEDTVLGYCQNFETRFVTVKQEPVDPDLDTLGGSETIHQFSTPPDPALSAHHQSPIRPSASASVEGDTPSTPAHTSKISILVQQNNGSHSSAHQDLTSMALMNPASKLSNSLLPLKAKASSTFVSSGEELPIQNRPASDVGPSASPHKNNQPVYLLEESATPDLGISLPSVTTPGQTLRAKTVILPVGSTLHPAASASSMSISSHTGNRVFPTMLVHNNIQSTEPGPGQYRVISRSFGKSSYFTHRHRLRYQYKCVKCSEQLFNEQHAVQHMEASHQVDPEKAIDFVKAVYNSDYSSSACAICDYNSRTFSNLQFHRYFKHKIPLPTECRLRRCDLCLREFSHEYP